MISRFLLLCALVYRHAILSAAQLSSDLVAVTQSNSWSIGFNTSVEQYIIRISSSIDDLYDDVNSGNISTAIGRANATCLLAELVFPEHVFFPTDDEYEAEQIRNWSETCWLPAACFIRPKNSLDVALVVKIITRLGSQYSVRSRGHNPNPGFSSVGNAGVLLDLQDLDSLTLDADNILRAGVGHVWKDLWDAAEGRNRTVIGAREQGVGITGCILGGGMPYFPSLHGLAADSVRNFEIVLANSSIIDANSEQHPELFRSLKCGGPNFGIITQFDVDTHPLIHAQYSINTYNATEYANIMDATVRVQEQMESDPKIDIFVTFSPSAITVGLFYADWVAEPPSSFAAFEGLTGFLGSTVPTTNGTVGTLAASLASSWPEYEARHLPSAVTTKVNIDMYNNFYLRFLGISQDIKNSLSVNMSFALEPMSSNLAREGVSRGGNSCGIPAAQQTWWSLNMEWQDSSDDAAVQYVLDMVHDNLTSLAAESGLMLDYQFMNHAGPLQTVLDSYGPTNLDRLRSVAQIYDPAGLLQNLQNDGFLLRKL